MRVVSIVEDQINEVGIEYVSMEDVSWASLLITPSPIVKFGSISDLFIGMYNV